MLRASEIYSHDVQASISCPYAGLPSMMWPADSGKLAAIAKINKEA